MAIGDRVSAVELLLSGADTELKFLQCVGANFFCENNVVLNPRNGVAVVSCLSSLW